MIDQVVLPGSHGRAIAGSGGRSGERPRLVAVLPAAGGGSRFGAHLPKQYIDLAGRPLIAHTIERLASALDFAAIVVALAPDDELFEARVATQKGVRAVHCGGATRAATVTNALEVVQTFCGPDDWILVHDAARPCVPVDALQRLLAELADDPVGGLLAVPVADTLKRQDASAAPRVLRTEDRSALWCAQTPQMFRFGVLRAALAASGALASTDEAQAVEALAATGVCARPRLVMGSPLNLKITFPGDLALAEAILVTQHAARDDLPPILPSAARP